MLAQFFYFTVASEDPRDPIHSNHLNIAQIIGMNNKPTGTNLITT